MFSVRIESTESKAPIDCKIKLEEDENLNTKNYTNRGNASNDKETRVVASIESTSNLAKVWGKGKQYGIAIKYHLIYGQGNLRGGTVGFQQRWTKTTYSIVKALAL